MNRPHIATQTPTVSTSVAVSDVNVVTIDAMSANVTAIKPKIAY